MTRSEPNKIKVPFLIVQSILIFLSILGSVVLLLDNFKNSAQLPHSLGAMLGKQFISEWVPSFFSIWIGRMIVFKWVGGFFSQGLLGVGVLLVHATIVGDLIETTHFTQMKFDNDVARICLIRKLPKQCSNLISEKEGDYFLNLPEDIKLQTNEFLKKSLDH